MRARSGLEPIIEQVRCLFVTTGLESWYVYMQILVHLL